MPNLSKLKRERMLAFLQKIKDEHRDDDDMLIALGEIECELTSKKYGLVWEQHEEAVDVMMRDNIPVFTEVLRHPVRATTSFWRAIISTPCGCWRKPIKVESM